jgi:uracil-DNA glycosylase
MLSAPRTETLQDRRDRLLALAKRRQAADWGFMNLKQYQGGSHECDHVSPWSKTAGNVGSELFFLLQDWSSDANANEEPDPETLVRGYTPGMRTDDTLIRRLQEHFNASPADVYGTNLFPFIKPGRISAPIPWKALTRAAEEFALPQIDIVRPRLVLAFGKSCFNAIEAALGHQPSGRLSEAIEKPIEYTDTRIWCLAHPAWDVVHRRGSAAVTADWGKAAAWYFDKRAEV